MHTQKIEWEEGMLLEIAAGEGDLSIRGLDEPFLWIEPTSDVELEQSEEKVLLRLQRDARLKVFQDAHVTVSQLNGDLRVRGVKGSLHLTKIAGDVILSHAGNVLLGEINGDVSMSRTGDIKAEGYLDDDVALRQVGIVDIQEVGGDLAVRGADALSVGHVDDDAAISSIGGEVRFQEIRGDGILRRIQGAVEIGRVRGDLILRNLEDNILVTRVDGDVSLYSSFKEDRTYRLACRRKIRVRFPEQTTARFVIKAPRWEFPQSFTVESEEEGRIVVRVGEGGPDIHLSADGDVVLGAVAADDWERNIHEFGHRMEAWGEEFGHRMEAWGDDLRRRVEQADWERFGREIEEATARVAQLVETRLQEIDVEEMRQRAEQAAGVAEEKLQSVDWERLSRKIDEAIQQGVSQAHVGLERLQERLQRRQEKLQRVEERHLRAEERSQEHIQRAEEHRQRAEEKMQRAQEKIERAAERRRRQEEPAVEAPVAGPEAEVEPVVETAPKPAETVDQGGASAYDSLDEERMAVLSLVEEGRLTAEEAGALLDALEE